MNKFVSLLIVLLAIAVATPVLAEDRLSLSGQMRVRGFHIDNQFDFNDDAAGANTWYNQRFRLMGKIAVAEGVSVDFRLDVSDKTWGRAEDDFGTDTTHMGTDGDLRAFLTVDKSMFNIKAGRMSYSIGNAIAVDTIGEGAVFTLKGAVPVEVGYFKLAEDTPAHRDNDEDLYTVAVKHKTDMYNAVIFGGFYRDGSALGSSGKVKVYLGGVQTAMKLDPINLNFELNYFDGEQDWTGGRDLKGLQAYLDANMAISETVTAGAAFFYAQGQDDNDIQITDLSDDGGFLPETYSFMQGQFNIFPTGNGSLNTTFDPSGDGKGVYGAQVYGNFKVMDALSLRASVGYWQMEEDYSTAEKADADENDSAFDSFITVTGSARYALAAKTNLDFVAAYTIPDAATSQTEDDEALLLGFNLNVNF